jgi:hypothetical protein
MRIPRTLGTTVVLTTVAGLGFVSPLVPHAVAAPLPAPYAAAASADVLRLDADLAGFDLADVGLGHAEADADSTRPSGDTSARSSNIAAALGGFPVPLQQVSSSAAPNDSDTGTVSPVEVPVLLSLGLLQSDTAARYTTDAVCPSPATGDGRVLSSGSTRLAGLSVGHLDLAGGVTLASVGASATTTTTRLVNRGGPGSEVVARATTEVGDVSLLGGQVEVHVVDPVVLTATSDGTAGTVTSSAPTVQVRIADGAVLDLGDQPDQTWSGVLPIGPLAEAAVSVSLVDLRDDSAGPTGSAELDALLSVGVDVDAAGGLVDLADVTLDVAPMAVTATAPAGGVGCPALDPAGDADGDGLTNGEETDGSENDAHGNEPTDPTDADTDDDGHTDGDETAADTDPNDPRDPSDRPAPGPLPGGGGTGGGTGGGGTGGGTGDGDRDWLTDAQEGEVRTDPADPDTDGDGLTDGHEVIGLWVADQVVRCGGRVRQVGRVRTDPLDADTDGDRLRDGREAAGTRVRQQVVVTLTGRRVTLGLLRSNPAARDTDADGLADGAEVRGSRNTAFGRAATDPGRCDTDRGGNSDGAEVRSGSNPADRRSSPRAPRP